MVVAGRCAANMDNETNNYFYQNRVKYEQGEREKCTTSDIEKATTLIGRFAKAHADVSMGRGEAETNRLVPSDLFSNNTSDQVGVLERRTRLANTTQQLTNSNKVKVPAVRDNAAEMNYEVAKVKITKNIPDPALVATKAAINWSSRCGQNLLPTCSDDESEMDSLEAELYEIAREQYDAVSASSHPSTPTGLTVGLAGSARRVTLSPGGMDGFDDEVSDLDDDGAV
jgi:hypothetical protein